MNKSSSLYLSLIFFIGCIFFVRAMLFLDPDFGWHMRMGEIILHHGIPHTDPLSYTMPNYPFVDHEWISNSIMALLYPSIGIIGFAFAETIVILSIFYLSVGKPKNLLHSSAILLAASVILPISGIRPMLISWFNLSILLGILSTNKNFQRYGWSLPILFFLWSSMHGGFAVGIAILILHRVCTFWQQKRLSWFDVIVTLLSVVATIMTPYTWHIWWEVWMQVSDTALRWQIAEWYPAVFYFGLGFIVFLSLSTFFILRYKKHVSPARLGVWLFLFTLGLSSIRHIPLWVIATLPLLVKTLDWFRKDMFHYGHNAQKRFYVFERILFGFCLLIFIIEAIFALLEASKTREQVYYPYKAVAFLAQFHRPLKIFTPYEWAGYVLWKVPQSQTFIDGRMPSWRWISSDLTKSDYAFKEYVMVMEKRLPFQTIQQKYSIDTVVLPKKRKEERGTMEQSGMVNVYEDDQAIVYQRTK